MKISKRSNYVGITQRTNFEKFIVDIDKDVENLCLLPQGRIRFGTSTTKTGTNLRGENLSGEFITFQASNSTTNFGITHYLGAIPQGWIVISQSGPGTLYAGSTANTTSTAYFMSTTSATNYTIFLLK